MEALSTLEKLKASDSSSINVDSLIESFFSAMNDDFNAPILVANLFEAVKFVNSVKDGKATITKSDLENLTKTMNSFIVDVLGISVQQSSNDDKLSPVMDLVLDLRQGARTNKDWGTSDKIRDGLAAAGIVVKDEKEGTSWS